MSTPENVIKQNQLREERQDLLDKRNRLLKRGRLNAAQAAARDAQVRRWERRMTAIDKELDKITGTSNNWRRDITPNQ